jgi:catechol 2,3-dioxygenase-like lactoylglutathione lyase family enzyme
MKLDGLHHVSAITADANANLDFYGRVLGLRLIWQGGFVFEPPEHLGETLVLVGDLEHRRAELQQRFPSLPKPRASA